MSNIDVNNRFARLISQLKAEDNDKKDEENLSSEEQEQEQENRYTDLSFARNDAEASYGALDMKAKFSKLVISRREVPDISNVKTSLTIAKRVKRTDASAENTTPSALNTENTTPQDVQSLPKQPPVTETSQPDVEANSQPAETKNTQNTSSSNKATLMSVVLSDEEIQDVPTDTTDNSLEEIDETTSQETEEITDEEVAEDEEISEEEPLGEEEQIPEETNEPQGYTAESDWNVEHDGWWSLVEDGTLTEGIYGYEASRYYRDGQPFSGYSAEENMYFTNGQPATGFVTDENGATLKVIDGTPYTTTNEFDENYDGKIYDNGWALEGDYVVGTDGGSIWFRPYEQGMEISDLERRGFYYDGSLQYTIDNDGTDNGYITKADGKTYFYVDGHKYTSQSTEDAAQQELGDTLYYDGLALDGMFFVKTEDQYITILPYAEGAETADKIAEGFTLGVYENGNFVSEYIAEPTIKEPEKPAEPEIIIAAPPPIPVAIEGNIHQHDENELQILSSLGDFNSDWAIPEDKQQYYEVLYVSDGSIRISYDGFIRGKETSFNIKTNSGTGETTIRPFVSGISGGAAKEYTYNSDKQLIKEETSTPSLGPSGWTNTIIYDGYGNKISETKKYKSPELNGGLSEVVTTFALDGSKTVESHYADNRIQIERYDAEGNIIPDAPETVGLNDDNIHDVLVNIPFLSIDNDAQISDIEYDSDGNNITSVKVTTDTETFVYKFSYGESSYEISQFKYEEYEDEFMGEIYKYYSSANLKIALDYTNTPISINFIKDGTDVRLLCKNYSVTEGPYGYVKAQSKTSDVAYYFTNGSAITINSEKFFQWINIDSDGRGNRRICYSGGPNWQTPLPEGCKVVFADNSEIVLLQNGVEIARYNEKGETLPIKENSISIDNYPPIEEPVISDEVTDIKKPVVEDDKPKILNGPVENEDGTISFYDNNTLLENITMVKDGDNWVKTFTLSDSMTITINGTDKDALLEANVIEDTNKNVTIFASGQEGNEPVIKIEGTGAFGEFENKTIRLETNNVVVENYASGKSYSLTILGSQNSDRIYNYGNRVTINGNGGDDYIEAHQDTHISGGAGNDTVIADGTFFLNFSLADKDLVVLKGKSMDVNRYYAKDSRLVKMYGVNRVSGFRFYNEDLKQYVNVNVPTGYDAKLDGHEFVIITSDGDEVCRYNQRGEIISVSSFTMEEFEQNVKSFDNFVKNRSSFLPELGGGYVFSKDFAFDIQTEGQPIRVKSNQQLVNKLSEQNPQICVLTNDESGRCIEKSTYSPNGELLNTVKIYQPGNTLDVSDGIYKMEYDDDAKGYILTEGNSGVIFQNGKNTGISASIEPINEDAEGHIEWRYDFDNDEFNINAQNYTVRLTGDGNQNIKLEGDNVNITFDKVYSFENNAANSKININTSEEDAFVSVKNNADNVTIFGSSKDDYIKNHGNNVVINGFGGDDYIVSDANYTTISGGSGDDIINAKGEILDGGNGIDQINERLYDMNSPAVGWFTQNGSTKMYYDGYIADNIWLNDSKDGLLKYFINGDISKDTGVFKDPTDNISKLVVKGELANGYISDDKFVGMNIMADNFMFVDGQVANNVLLQDPNDGQMKLFVGGKPASGFIDDIYYDNGKIAPDGTYAGQLVLNGKVADYVEYQDKFYIDGKPAEGIVLNTLYLDGKVVEGEVGFIEWNDGYTEFLSIDEAIEYSEMYSDEVNNFGIFKDGQRLTGEASDGRIFKNGNILSEAKYAVTQNEDGSYEIYSDEIDGVYYLNGVPAQEPITENTSVQITEEHIAQAAEILEYIGVSLTDEQQITVTKLGDYDMPAEFRVSSNDGSPDDVYALNISKDGHYFVRHTKDYSASNVQPDNLLYEDIDVDNYTKISVTQNTNGELVYSTSRLDGGQIPEDELVLGYSEDGADNLLVLQNNQPYNGGYGTYVIKHNDRYGDWNETKDIIYLNGTLADGAYEIEIERESTYYTSVTKHRCYFENGRLIENHFADNYRYGEISNESFMRYQDTINISTNIQKLDNTTVGNILIVDGKPYTGDITATKTAYNRIKCNIKDENGETAVEFENYGEYKNIPMEQELICKFIDGKVAQGIYNVNGEDIMYKDGIPANDITVGDKYYIEGKVANNVFVGIKAQHWVQYENSGGLENYTISKLYIKGQPADGEYINPETGVTQLFNDGQPVEFSTNENDQTCVNNIPLNGIVLGRLYQNGYLADDTSIGGKYYRNGKIADNVVVDGTFYRNGQETDMLSNALSEVGLDSSLAEKCTYNTYANGLISDLRIFGEENNFTEYRFNENGAYTSSVTFENGSFNAVYADGTSFNGVLNIDGEKILFANGEVLKIVSDIPVSISDDGLYVMENGAVLDGKYIINTDDEGNVVSASLNDESGKLFIQGVLADNMYVEVDGEQIMYKDGVVADYQTVTIDNKEYMFIEGKKAHGGVQVGEKFYWNGIGYDEHGFDDNGINRETNRKTSLKGFYQSGININGSRYDGFGYDIDGFDRKGWNKDGINKETNSRWDMDGKDINGKYAWDIEQSEPPEYSIYNSLNILTDDETFFDMALALENAMPFLSDDVKASLAANLETLTTAGTENAIKAAFNSLRSTINNLNGSNEVQTLKAEVNKLFAASDTASRILNLSQYGNLQPEQELQEIIEMFGESEYLSLLSDAMSFALPYLSIDYENVKNDNLYKNFMALANTACGDDVAAFGQALENLISNVKVLYDLNPESACKQAITAYYGEEYAESYYTDGDGHNAIGVLLNTLDATKSAFNKGIVPPYNSIDDVPAVYRTSTLRNSAKLMAAGNNNTWTLPVTTRTVFRRASFKTILEKANWGQYIIGKYSDKTIKTFKEKTKFTIPDTSEIKTEEYFNDIVTKLMSEKSAICVGRTFTFSSGASVVLDNKNRITQISNFKDGTTTHNVKVTYTPTGAMTIEIESKEKSGKVTKRTVSADKDLVATKSSILEYSDGYYKEFSYDGDYKILSYELYDKTNPNNFKTQKFTPYANILTEKCVKKDNYQTINYTKKSNTNSCIYTTDKERITYFKSDVKTKTDVGEIATQNLLLLIKGSYKVVSSETVLDEKEHTVTSQLATQTWDLAKVNSRFGGGTSFISLCEDCPGKYTFEKIDFATRHSEDNISRITKVMDYDELCKYLRSRSENIEHLSGSVSIHGDGGTNSTYSVDTIVGTIRYAKQAITSYSMECKYDGKNRWATTWTDTSTSYVYGDEVENVDRVEVYINDESSPDDEEYHVEETTGVPPSKTPQKEDAQNIRYKTAPELKTVEDIKKFEMKDKYYKNFPVNISQAGIDLIKQYEGCVLYTYDDKAPRKKGRTVAFKQGDKKIGTLTIGYGHTGADVTPGRTITQSQAEDYLKTDTMYFCREILKAVKVPLTQNQFDALMSFVYNVGPGNFRSSTLLKLLNSGDYAGAAAQLDKWIYNGKDKKGNPIVSSWQVKRRAAEKAMFLGV